MATITTIKVNGKVQNLPAKIANAMATKIITENPASKAWLTLGESLPAKLLEAIKDAKNAAVIIEVNQTSQGVTKSAKLTFGNIVAKVNLSKAMSELASKTPGWKYAIESSGTALAGEDDGNESVEFEF